MKKRWLNYLVIPMGLALLYIGVSILISYVLPFSGYIFGFIIILVILFFALIKKKFKSVGIFILSIVFTFLIYESYQKLGMTPLGIKVFNPTLKKNLKDHFKKRYGMSYIITGVFYSYNRNKDNELKWYTITEGYQEKKNIKNIL